MAKHKVKSKMDWFMLSLLGMLFLSAMFLAFRKLGSLGVNSYTIIIFEFAIATAILTSFAVLTKTNILPSNSTIWLLLLAIGIFGAIGNILLTQGIISAPNPGYALAIVNANVVLVSIASFFLFKSDITLTKGIGIIFAVLGVILLGL